VAHDSAFDLLPVAIPALATIAVAWIARARGHRAAERDEPFAAQEHGEHAHTRDVVKLEAQGIIDRIELADVARGLARQSAQIGVSADRLAGKSEEQE
jgi:hypothetical protein